MGCVVVVVLVAAVMLFDIGCFRFVVSACLGCLRCRFVCDYGCGLLFIILCFWLVLLRCIAYFGVELLGLVWLPLNAARFVVICLCYCLFGCVGLLVIWLQW